MRALALVVLLALAGCTVSSAEAGGTGKRWRWESLKAACMAERGFKYEMWVPDRTLTPEALRRADGHYASMRRHRERYGHGVFSGYVHRTTQEAGGVDLHPSFPNDRYISALSASQQTAYHQADQECFTRAVKAVLGRDVTAVDDLHRLHGAAHRALDEREFDSDPRLVALARDYAACLRAKGYPVSTEKPSQISHLEEERFRAKLSALGREQNPGAEPGMEVMPTLTREEAMPHLREEISSALDDLECGKEFFPAYHPRHRVATDRLRDEWGLGS
ncbi:hypothetical protein ACBI99_28420 [Nonomuraea sp. ATR24]|uniref:hypothetical protein n=1 Tax=Nonomuraea sp. ATR24 TaxID=1676744 RepID=UPI0035C1B4DF